jgi:5-hydroxyisourate hydrolase
MRLKQILTLFLLIYSTLSFSQEKSYQLSSHILDVSLGKPASLVKIELEKLNSEKNWVKIDENITDKDGRVKNFLPENNKDNRGIYKLRFYTAEYFNRLNKTSFYPFIEVVFEIKDNEHYHVPITLSAYGYSTYRGS